MNDYTDMKKIIRKKVNGHYWHNLVISFVVLIGGYKYNTFHFDNVIHTTEKIA